MTLNQGKTIFISPSFFGYEKDIADELSRQGFAVHSIDERPSNNSLFRAIVRVRKRALNRTITRHYHKCLAKLRNVQIELVIVIKAEVVPRWFLEELRTLNPDARFVFYAYDAIKYSPNCVDVFDCFDHRFSFDRSDVAEYKGMLEYLPMFYTKEYNPQPGSDKKWLASFVGTLHSDRFAFSQQIVSGLPRTFVFYFVQARWYFAVVKYLTREHPHVTWRDVSFVPMDRNQIADVFRQSKVVLDFPRPGQSGLTMRTFEVLASGAILVTTNQSIRYEPFYDESRILLIPAKLESEALQRLRESIRTMPTPAGSPPDFDAYSLSNWVKNLTRSGG